MIERIAQVERKVQTLTAGDWTMTNKRVVISRMLDLFPEIDAEVAILDLTQWWDWADNSVQLDPVRRVETMIDGERKMLIAKYNGGFVTRLKKWYRLNGGTNVNAPQWSVVGNTYMSYRPVEQTVHFDFTRGPFDWVDGDFGDRGSCYWGGRSVCRDILHEHGAWAVRLWDTSSRDPESSYEGGMGRAWIIPWGQSIILYNGYRRDDDDEALHNDNVSEWYTRWISTWLTASWRRIDLRNQGRWDGTFYINSGSGYLIAHPESIRDIYNPVIDLDWHEYRRRLCPSCGERYNNDDACHYASMRGSLRVSIEVCSDCYNDNAERCTVCADPWVRGAMVQFGEFYACRSCAPNVTLCDDCGIPIGEHNTIRTRSHAYCSRCANVHLVRCTNCNNRHEREDVVSVIGLGYICTDCRTSNVFTCTSCQRAFSRSSWAVDAGLCLDCYIEREMQ